MSYFTPSLGVLPEKSRSKILQSRPCGEVRSILDHPWTADELLSYFGDLPVSQWFNPNSPRVKAREVTPDDYDGPYALSAMLHDRLLIRRPLLQAGASKKCGFDLEEIHSWLGVASQTLNRDDDLQSCSAVAAGCNK